MRFYSLMNVKIVNKPLTACFIIFGVHDRSFVRIRGFRHALRTLYDFRQNKTKQKTTIIILVDVYD